MKTCFKILTLLSFTLTLTAGNALAAHGAPAPAPATAPSAAPAHPTFTKGKVVETMDSGGYTYLCIENGGEKRWAAIPQAEVKVGQEVELAPGMEMGQFSSKTLGRTFDSIYFCSGLAAAPGKLPHPVPEASQGAKPAAGGMPPGHGMPAAGMPAAHGMPSAAKPAADAPQATPVAGKVAETFDGGGYTYVAVEQNGQRTWVATPPIKVTVGQNVTFVPGYVMRNFTSKSVDRTFDAIIFSSGLATAAAPAATPAAGK